MARQGSQKEYENQSGSHSDFLNFPIWIRNLNRTTETVEEN